jgi:hypothetical protein
VRLSSTDDVTRNSLQVVGLVAINGGVCVNGKHGSSC